MFDHEFTTHQRRRTPATHKPVAKDLGATGPTTIGSVTINDITATRTGENKSVTRSATRRVGVEAKQWRKRGRDCMGIDAIWKMTILTWCFRCDVEMS